MPFRGSKARTSLCSLAWSFCKVLALHHSPQEWSTAYMSRDGWPLLVIILRYQWLSLKLWLICILLKESNKEQWLKISYEKVQLFSLPCNWILPFTHKLTVLSLASQSASFSLLLLTVNLEATPGNFLKSFQFKLPTIFKKRRHQ